MTWQDVVIATLQFTFLIALLPTLMQPTKPAFTTCLWTAFALTVVGACFLTMGLYLSTAGIWAPAAGWWVLVKQTRRPV